MTPDWADAYQALTSGRASAELGGWRVFRFSGPDRKKFLHGLVTADVLGLSPGAGTAACLLTPKGLLQAQFWLYDAQDALVAVCPGECAENLRGGISKMIMLSDSTMEEVEGPVYLARGARGYDAKRFGEGFVFDAGSPPLPAVAGPEPFEALRVERAWPRYGVDVDASTIPLEAGMEDAISFTKGCYMGQETISRVHHFGHVNKMLKLLEFDAKPALGPVDAGKLTSASWSPAKGKWLGLATVRLGA